MKGPGAVSALAAAAAGVLAFVLAQHMATCWAAGSGLDRLQDVSFLRAELALTDPQVEQITILHAALAARLRDCCAQRGEACARLGQALADETNSVARANAALSDLCRAYEETERATLEHIRQVRTVLNAKQRKRFDRMLMECLCRNCPACDAPGRRDRTGLPCCRSGCGTNGHTHALSGCR